MESHINTPMLLTFASLLLCFISTTVEATAQSGFTVDLFHRDSVLSPWFNSSATKWTIVNNAIQRSISRAKQFKFSSNGAFDTSLLPASGEFVMKLAIGTPPSPFIAIVDTGSDLIWTQCKPCLSCYNQSIPVFDPRKSSTFKPVGCKSTQCNRLGINKAGCSRSNSCLYVYQYGDQSMTKGDLVSETLVFGRWNSVHNIVLGCGHQNGGSFYGKGSGLIGLGGGPMSLLSQMGKSVEGKLAYCMVPFMDTSSTGKIMLGADAVVSGAGVVSTPLLRGEPSTFYYLNLEGMSVGNRRRIPFKSPYVSSFNGDDAGNIIIDSGTTLTMLPDEFFSDLTTALSDTISAEPVSDPQGILQLCYATTAVDPANLPVVTAHFTGGDVELKPINTFVPVDDSTVCLAMLSSSMLGMPIFGNLAQMNFLVGYDVQGGTVSFKPTDCSSL